MPAVSKAQQRAAGIALAAQRGIIPRSKLRGASKSMFNMENKSLRDFAKTSLKGKPDHAPKKWWGGPLDGFAPWQSQGSAAFKGLGMLQRPQGRSYAPMMPSLSALMAPPGQNLPMPTAIGPNPTPNPTPPYGQSPLVPLQPPAAAPIAPNPAFGQGQGGPTLVPGVFGFARGGRPDEGKRSILGAGKTKVNASDMKLQSDIGLSLLPDDFYYMPGPKIKGAKPEHFMPMSPQEKRMDERDPGRFGYSVASNDHTGLLDSDVPGRTDQLPISVAAGSYVLPADVVSGFGQGNTRAGAKMLIELLNKYEQVALNSTPESNSSGPKVIFAGREPYPGKAGTRWDEDLGFVMNTSRKQAQEDNIPVSNIRLYGETARANGGEVRQSIPIVAAGGELVVPPNIVMQVGEGDELKGHAALDNLVLKIRAQVAKRLTKLPPPRRD